MANECHPLFAACMARVRAAQPFSMRANHRIGATNGTGRVGFGLTMVFVCSALFLLPQCAPALQGWGYLVERLVRDGEPRAEVERIFSDPRMPPFDGLKFSPEPKPESPTLYRGFLAPRSVAQARACLRNYRAEIARAERATGVPGTLLASLLHVESRCGQNTGRHRVLFRLARLAMAGEPNNLRWNVDSWLDVGWPEPAALREKFSLRARYLEDTFYPEVRAALELARRWRVDPLELRGSSAGALGWPQFLPSSVLRFARDADNDGLVNLSSPADAAMSAAEYLRAHGWAPRATSQQQRQALWSYNPSAAYVNTLLALHRRLQPNALSSPRKESGTVSSGSRRSNRRESSPGAHRKLARR